MRFDKNSDSRANSPLGPQGENIPEDLLSLHEMNLQESQGLYFIFLRKRTDSCLFVCLFVFSNYVKESRKGSQCYFLFTL